MSENDWWVEAKYFFSLDRVDCPLVDFGHERMPDGSDASNSCLRNPQTVIRPGNFGPSRRDKNRKEHCHEKGEQDLFSD